MKCQCGNELRSVDGQWCTHECSKCYRGYQFRSVWYRNTNVSYTREMDIELLLPDGTVKGDLNAWWEPWT